MPSPIQTTPDRILGVLSRIAVLADLDPPTLQRVAQGAQPLGYEMGETVFSQGDAGDAFYVIVRGNVRVVGSPDPKDPDKEVWLSTLGPGDHFGEVALVTGLPRTSTCRTTGDEQTVLLRIPRSLFLPLLEAQPRLKERFLRLGDLYRAWNYLTLSTPLGQALGRDGLRELATRLQPRQFKRGEVVSKAGDPDSPLVFVRAGWAQVAEPGTTGGMITEGKHCGEQPVLAGQPSAAAITAATDAELLLGERRLMLELMARIPELRAWLEQNPSRPVTTVKAQRKTMEFGPVEQTVFFGLAGESSKESTGDSDRLAVPSSMSSGPPPKKPPPKQPTTGTAKKLRRPLFYRVFRFPFIRQHDERDCGAASLAMIARYYGKKLSLSRLRDLANVNTEGASLQSLARGAEAIGFVARGGRFTGEVVDRQTLPAIAHWGGFHFVVLYRIDKRTAWVADPALGLRRLSRAEFDQTFTGFMLLLEPTEKLLDVREAKTGYRRMWTLVRPYGVLLFEILLASFLLDLFGLVSPLFTQAIVDQVIPHQNVSLLKVMLVGMGILAVFRIATAALRSYLIANLSARLDLRMLLKLYFHVLSLPVSFFKLRKTGDILSRFAENAKIRSVLAGSAVATFLDVGMVSVYLALMFLYSVKLTLAVIAFIPVVVLVTLLFTPLIKRRSLNVAVAYSEQEAHLVESVGAIETIKALGVERPIRWRWEALFAKYLRASYDASKLETLLGSISETLTTVSSIALLGFGAYLVIQGELTIGQLMAFNALVAAVMAPIGGLIALWDKIQQALVAMDRLNDVFDSEPEEAGGPSALIDPGPVRGAIKFDQVFFRYGSDGGYVLENLSISIAAGQTVAIVGRSGSGKSTLVRLILKLYVPTEGVLTIDGLDVTTVSAHALRRRIGFVPQDVALMSGSIAENIAFGVDEIDRDRVEEVARIAEAHGFITAMPLGYDTLVGERGLTLSGGQRQRIAIARALYHDPKVLIFDEATASLDTESEAAIQENLQRITAGRTAIIIAHRMSTVKNADRILVLEKGQLLEEGTHEELFATRGLYYHLCSRQLEQ